MSIGKRSTEDWSPRPSTRYQRRQSDNRMLATLLAAVNQKRRRSEWPCQPEPDVAIYHRQLHIL